MILNELIGLVGQVKSIEESIIENEGEIDLILERAYIETNLKCRENIDSWYGILKWNEDKLESLKTQRQTITEKIRRIEKWTEQIKNITKEIMLANNLKKIEGDKTKFSLCKGRPSVEVDDPASLPVEYRNTEITYHADKKKIIEAHNQGISIDGTKIIETYTLKKGETG